tara:strand:- start:393 stop:566 length:174 start_codon:yes stop_codon:yes gene_type:complete
MKKTIIEKVQKNRDFKEEVLTNTTRKEIEKSYGIDIGQGTEAYFSDRYGWTLRKTIK